MGQRVAAATIAVGLLLAGTGGAAFAAEADGVGYFSGGAWFGSYRLPANTSNEVYCVDSGRAAPVTPGGPAYTASSITSDPKAAYLLAENGNTNDIDLADAVTLYIHNDAGLPHSNETPPGFEDGGPRDPNGVLNDLAAITAAANKYAGPYQVSGAVTTAPTAGSGDAAVTFTVRSAAGAAMSGVVLDFAKTGSTQGLGAGSGTTNAAGQVGVAFTLANGAAGGVSATAANLPSTSLLLYTPTSGSNYQRMVGPSGVPASGSASAQATRPAAPTSKVSVHKTAGDTGKPLAGAVFAVRIGSTVYATGTTDGAGMWTSPALPLAPGTAVEIDETAAPASYTTVTAQIVHTTSDGAGTGTYTAVDQRSIAGLISVKKVDSATGSALPGTVFTAQVEKSGTSVFVAVTGGAAPGTTESAGRYTTSSSGLASLNGNSTTPKLASGDQIRFTEVQAAPGHITPANATVTGIIGDSGVLTVNLANQSFARIHLVKTASGVTPARYVGGAHFQISRVVNGTKQVLVADAVTDDNGDYNWVATGTESPAVLVGDTITFTETQVPLDPVTGQPAYSLAGPVNATVDNQPAAAFGNETFAAEAAVRVDIADKPIPKIGTTAENGNQALDKNVTAGTLTDTIAYTNVQPGQSYTATGVFQVVNANGTATPTNITGSATFTPTAASGSVVVTFPVPGALVDKYAGDTLVAFETLSQGGVTVAIHASVTDHGQTVYVPKVGTTATSANANLGKVAAIGANLQDTVAYSGLEAGKAYTLSGVFMVAVAGSAPTSTGITGSTTFTPTTSFGTAVVTFPVSAALIAKYAGQQIVAFETLAQNGNTVAVHQDITDQGQSVPVPSIGTTAQNGNAALGKTVTPGTLTDTIAYTNLVPGKPYTATGVFQVVSSAGIATPTSITGSATFTPTASSGSVVVTFPVPQALVDKYAGDTLVAFETLSQGGVQIVIHASVTDHGQTVYVPKIGTTVANGNGKSGQLATAGGTVVDHIAYTNLVVGKAYTAAGEFQAVVAGKPVATGIKGVATFTPTATTGSVNVTFPMPADMSKWAGQPLVAFETLSQGGVAVSINANINDTPETVYVPGIGTTAQNADTTLGKVVTAGGHLTDTVRYAGLLPGKTYVVTGAFQDVVAGKATPTGVNGSATFVPTTSVGSVVVTFAVPADLSAAAGQTWVAFETVTLNGVIIAAHVNATDTSQTVYVPTIGTTLYGPDGKANGPAAVVNAQGGVTLSDSIGFQGLQPGVSYVASGELEYADGRDTGISGTVRFQPTASSGVTAVPFQVPGNLLASGNTLVVAFESVALASKPGTPVAVHHDLAATSQQLTLGFGQGQGGGGGGSGQIDTGLGAQGGVNVPLVVGGVIVLLLGAGAAALIVARRRNGTRPQ